MSRTQFSTITSSAIPFYSGLESTMSLLYILALRLGVSTGWQATSCEHNGTFVNISSLAIPNSRNLNSSRNLPRDSHSMETIKTRFSLKRTWLQFAGYLCTIARACAASLKSLLGNGSRRSKFRLQNFASLNPYSGT